MTTVHKNIWKQANIHRNHIDFEFIDGNEWRYNNSKYFYKWLLKLNIPKSSKIYIIKNINDIEEMKWEHIIINKSEYFFENFDFEIWARDFTWAFIYSKIGVVKYGKKG